MGLWFWSLYDCAILAQVVKLRNHFPAHPTNDLKTSARFSGFPREKPEKGQVALLFRGSSLQNLVSYPTGFLRTTQLISSKPLPSVVASTDNCVDHALKQKGVWLSYTCTSQTHLLWSVLKSPRSLCGGIWNLD